MSVDLTVKQHDTFPAITAVLSDVNGVMNLEGAVSVGLRMRSTKVAPIVVLEAACEILSASKGEVKYTWAEHDLDTPDTYNLEFEVEWSAGKFESYPTVGYLTVVVEPDLN